MHPKSPENNNTENSTSHQNYFNEKIYDDEVDLFELFSNIILKWKTISLIFFFCVLITFLAITFSKPSYKTVTTFFVVNPKNSEYKSSYSELLGISGSNNLEDQIVSILISQRIKYKVSESIYDQQLKNGKLTDEFNFKMKLLSKEDLIKKFNTDILKLNKMIQFNKEKKGLLEIQYSNPDPEISYNVVEHYIRSLKLIYENLELGVVRDVIKVLDSPEYPKVPVPKARAMKSGLVGILGVVIYIIVLIIKGQLDTSKNRNIH